MLLELISKEPALADIILRGSNAKTTINLNGTCKTFNAITKDDLCLHYIEHTKTCIPKMFESIVKKRMFSSCTEEEYDTEVRRISDMITDDNYTDVIDALTSEYYFYLFESVRAGGMQRDMYNSLSTKYHAFLSNFNGMDDDSEIEEDIDW